MIYVVGTSDMKRDGFRRWHRDAPNATVVVIQRPFSPLSLGPLVAGMNREEIVSSLEEYRKWLFRQLEKNQKCISEFTRILDIVIEEGDVVLQCSCTNDKFCHGTIIRDALVWAMPLGIENWHNQLVRQSVPK